MTVRIAIKGSLDPLGALLLEGGLEQLIALPAMATPDTNNWGEEDGVEVDVYSDNRLEPQELSLPLWSERNIFSDALYSPTIKLSVEEDSEVAFEVDLRPLRVEELERTPRGWAARLVCLRQERIQGDGGDWSGLVQLLEGSASTGVYLSPERKEDIRIEDPALGTVFFDGARTYSGGYRLDVPVLLGGSRLIDLWGKRVQLLNRLSARGLRTVSVPSEGASPVRGYYSSSSVRDVRTITSGRDYRCELTMTFTITER